jgi:hypothetical protein
LDLTCQPQILSEVPFLGGIVYLPDKDSCFLPAVEVFEGIDFHRLSGLFEEGLFGQGGGSIRSVQSVPSGEEGLSGHAAGRRGGGLPVQKIGKQESAVGWQ